MHSMGVSHEGFVTLERPPGGIRGLGVFSQGSGIEFNRRILVTKPNLFSPSFFNRSAGGGENFNLFWKFCKQCKISMGRCGRLRGNNLCTVWGAFFSNVYEKIIIYDFHGFLRLNIILKRVEGRKNSEMGRMPDLEFIYSDFIHFAIFFSLFIWN